MNGAAEAVTVPEVIVALDYPDQEAAFELVGRLPEGTWYKVGLELFTRGGPPLVRRLRQFTFRQHFRITAEFPRPSECTRCS